MGILNRRNAVTGWATWKVVSRLVKRKAPPPPPKKRPVKSAIAAVTAALLGTAAFIRLRKRKQD